VYGKLRVGIIGDWDAARVSHVATNDALGHAADALGLELEIAWLATRRLERRDRDALLAACDALWCAPGSPYESMVGALEAIRYARERDVPFTGT
jgi:CTP synthase (UTP-ammonia lyase)